MMIGVNTIIAGNGIKCETKVKNSQRWQHPGAKLRELGAETLTDAEIDNLVYGLYGLTEEERRMVGEGNILEQSWGWIIERLSVTVYGES